MCRLVSRLLIAALKHIPSTGARADGRTLDLPGAITVTAGVTLLVYGIVTTDRHGWVSASTIGLLAGALALIGMFVWIERRSKRPMMPLATLRNRALAGANIISWCSAACRLPDRAGLALPAAGQRRDATAGGVASPADLGRRHAGGLPCRPARWTRWAPRRVLIVGPLLGSAGLLWLASLKAGDPYVALMLPALVSTAGTAFCFVPVTMAGTRGVRCATTA